MKKEYKISLVLVILPLILFALPLLIQYVNNRDVGVFYFYGLNESNYNCGPECFNNRNNYLPNLDEAALYVPRVKEASEGKYPSDPYIKDYSNKFVLLMDAVPLLFYGVLAMFMPVDLLFFLNIFIMGVIIAFLFYYIINSYLKDKRTSIIISIFSLFFPYLIFKIFKGEVIGPGMLRIIPDYFVPDVMFTRFIHMSFALALFALSIILLDKFLSGDLNWKKKTGILLLLVLNAYTYFYTWVMIGGMLAVLAIIFIISKNYAKFKKIFLIGVFYIIGSTPILIKGFLLKSDPSANIYGMKSFAGGDIVNFALLLFLSLICVILFYVFLPEKSRKQILKNNFTKIILSGNIVSLLLVNTEFLGFIPQPWHFVIFFKYFIIMSLLVILFLGIKSSNLKETSKRKLRSGLIWIIYLGIILLIAAYSFFVISSQSFASKQMLEADREMIRFFNEYGKDKTVLTLSHYSNTLIPIYTDSYLYVPDKLYSLTTPEESVSRYVTACSYFDMLDVCVNMFYNDSLTNYWYKGKIVHQMDMEKAEEILIMSLDDKYMYDYDFILLTPLEMKFANLNKIEKDNSLVFSNSMYKIYERKK